LEEYAMTVATRWVLLAVTALTCVLAVGCESQNQNDKARDKDLERIARRDRERSRDRARDPDPVIARDRRERLDDRRGGMQEIPTAAVAVDAGDGARLEYEPSQNGVLYVYDADDDRVIYVSRIRDREIFRLDPEADRGTINTKTVFRGDLNPRHRYRLYFDRAN
jgi:hypothetical protein